MESRQGEDLEGQINVKTYENKIEPLLIKKSLGSQVFLAQLSYILTLFTLELFIWTPLLLVEFHFARRTFDRVMVTTLVILCIFFSYLIYSYFLKEPSISFTLRSLSLIIFGGCLIMILDQSLISWYLLFPVLAILDGILYFVVRRHFEDYYYSNFLMETVTEAPLNSRDFFNAFQYIGSLFLLVPLRVAVPKFTLYGNWHWALLFLLIFTGILFILSFAIGDSPIDLMRNKQEERGLDDLEKLTKDKKEIITDVNDPSKKIIRGGFTQEERELILQDAAVANEVARQDKEVFTKFKGIMLMLVTFCSAFLLYAGIRSVISLTYAHTKLDPVRSDASFYGKLVIFVVISGFLHLIYSLLKINSFIKPRLFATIWFAVCTALYVVNWFLTGKNIFWSQTFIVFAALNANTLIYRISLIEFTQSQRRHSNHSHRAFFWFSAALTMLGVEILLGNNLYWIITILGIVFSFFGVVIPFLI